MCHLRCSAWDFPLSSRHLCLQLAVLQHPLSHSPCANPHRGDRLAWAIGAELGSVSAPVLGKTKGWAILAWNLSDLSFGIKIF